MTGVHVHHGHFSSRDEVLDEIRRQGWWPTTLITPVSGELPLHTHATEVHAYVLEGQSWIRDGVTGEQLTIAPGDKLVIPEGVVHAEGATTAPMLYIVALPQPTTQKEFLRMQRADDPAAAAS